MGYDRENLCRNCGGLNQIYSDLFRFCDRDTRPDLAVYQLVDSAAGRANRILLSEPGVFANRAQSDRVDPCVWQVEKPRSFARRFSEYVSVLLIGPVLMFTAMTILGSLSSSNFITWLSGIEPFGTTIVTLAKLTPFIIVIFVFSFVYAFVPNTRVKIGAAAVGGATAGVVWATTGKIFAGIVAHIR